MYIFYMRLNQLSKHFCHSDWGISKTCILNASPLLQVSKNIDLFFFCLRTGIKRSHSVPSQDYMADDSSNRCFKCSSRCVRARIVVVKSDPFSAVGFPDSLKDNWQTNDCVPLRIEFRVILVVRLRHIQFYQKKKAVNWLEVLCVRETFVGFGSSWNSHTANCCLHSGSYA